jgi:TolA-binding protein
VKHLIVLCLALAALALPAAALADGNSPGAPTATTNAPHAGNGAVVANLHGLGKQVRALVAHCRKTKGAERAQCVQKLMSVLDQIKAKIDTLESRIEQACAGSTTGKCARAAQVVSKLEALKARIDKLEAKLASGATPSPSDPNTNQVESGLAQLSP